MKAVEGVEAVEGVKGVEGWRMDGGYGRST